MRARSTVIYDILRELRREANRSPKAVSLHLNTTPAVAEMLYGSFFDELEATEKGMGTRVVVRALPHFHPEQYEVYAR